MKLFNYEQYWQLLHNGQPGLPIERDLHFKATYPLSVYARAARSRLRTTTSVANLEKAAGHT